MRSNYQKIDYDPRFLKGLKHQAKFYGNRQIRKQSRDLMIVYDLDTKGYATSQHWMRWGANIALFLSVSVGLSSLAWALAHTKDFFQLRENVPPLNAITLPGFNNLIDWQPKTVEIQLPPPQPDNLDTLLSTKPFSPALDQSQLTGFTKNASATQSLHTQQPDSTDPNELQSILHQDPSWLSVTVQSGDSLSTIFDRHGLSSSELEQIVNLDKTSRSLKNLHPGQVIHIKTGDNGSILGLMKEMDLTHELRIMRADAKENTFVSSVHERQLENKTATLTGHIRTSLFDDGRKAGLSFDLINQLTTIFAWDVDFALNLQPGDRFAVCYEIFSYQDEEVKTGDILAAEFINDGKVYRAVRFTDPQGQHEYYTPEGNSLQKAFIRTPVKIGYVTSHFDPNRLHPILNKIKSHNGVDYSAPVGTPVYATGRGSVEFVGRKNGYGKTIIIDHGETYSTLYAHLSGFAEGLKKGQHVSQGQEIGYVGATGLATGPHLHYEFRIDGEHKNPLTVKLPNSMPIPEEYRAAFQQQVTPLLAQINQLNPVAQADETTAITHHPE